MSKQIRKGYTAFETYNIFYALKFHFDMSIDYDFFKYKGIAKTVRFDRFVEMTTVKRLCVKLSKTYSRGEIIGFFASNILTNNDALITMYDHTGMSNFMKWKRTVKNFHLTLIEEFRPYDKHSFMTSLRTRKNSLPGIVKDLLAERISYETFTYLAERFKLWDKYDIAYKDDFVWQTISYRSKQYKPFVRKFIHLSEDKIFDIIKTELEKEKECSKKLNNRNTKMILN